MTQRIGVIGGGAAGLATGSPVGTRRTHRRPLRAEFHARRSYRFDRAGRLSIRHRAFLVPDAGRRSTNISSTSSGPLRVPNWICASLDPAYTVFSPGSTFAPAQTITIPQGRARVLEVFERVERGSGRSLSRYLASADRTKNMAIDYFLYNPFTSPISMLRPEIMTALPTLVRQLGTSLERFSSASVRHPVLRQILQYPAIFLGTDPRTAPAIYHLMSALDLDDGVRYPMGGFRTIVDALTRIVEKSGVRVHTDAAVEHISAVPRSGRRRKATGLVWTDHEGRKHEHRCDIVVSAADLHHTETQLLDPVDRSFPASWWEKVTSGPGAILVFLGIEGEVPQLPHHSLFFTDDWSTNFDDIFGPRPKISSPASAYVCKPSHTDPSVAPPDHEQSFHPHTRAR